MFELDVYLQAAFAFMVVGAAAGCIVWLAGFAISSVFSFLNFAVDNPADM